MKKTLILFFAAITILAAVVPALAQFDDDRTSKVGIRVVALTPAASELRKLNAVWFGPQFDYNLKFDKENRVTDIVTLGSVTSGDKDQKASVTPLTYTHITRKGSSENSTSYFGIGAGVVLAKIRVIRTDSIGYPILVDDKAYLPEAHLVYGRDFRNVYFAEIQVNLSRTWKDDNWSAISLNIGTHSTF
jgi:hypothetical protein